MAKFRVSYDKDTGDETLGDVVQAVVDDLGLGGAVEVQLNGDPVDLEEGGCGAAAARPIGDDDELNITVSAEAEEEPVAEEEAATTDPEARPDL